MISTSDQSLVRFAGAEAAEAHLPAFGHAGASTSLLNDEANAPSILKKKHPINHTWVKPEGCMYVMFLIGNSGLRR